MNGYGKVAAFGLALVVSMATLPLSAGQLAHVGVNGVLQVNGQVHPTIVTQNGPANIAGVMQVGGSPSVLVRQSGRTNAAFVSQYENFSFAGSSGMP